jgi:hypothetical protein
VSSSRPCSKSTAGATSLKPPAPACRQRRPADSSGQLCETRRRGSRWKGKRYVDLFLPASEQFTSRARLHLSFHCREAALLREQRLPTQNTCQTPTGCKARVVGNPPNPPQNAPLKLLTRFSARVKKTEVSRIQVVSVRSPWGSEGGFASIMSTAKRCRSLFGRHAQRCRKGNSHPKSPLFRTPTASNLEKGTSS